MRIKDTQKDYLDDGKRSIANALQIFFKDGSQTDKVEVEYPVGHRNRRQEGIPLLERKFLIVLKVLILKSTVTGFTHCVLIRKELNKLLLTSLWTCL